MQEQFFGKTVLNSKVRTFSEEELTQDAFLGGKLTLRQPRIGYRAGVDPVFLAASVPAKPGDRVLELGCGAGPALLCLGARVSGLHLWGVERQPDYSELARWNAESNGLDAVIETNDLRDLSAELRQMSFDHVIANPPYYDPSQRVPAQDSGKEAGLSIETPLADWIKAAAKRTAPRGTVTFIHRAEKLPELISGFAKYLGSVEVKPFVPRTGRDAGLVLIRGRKEGRAPFRLHAPIVLHQGSQHMTDGDDYRAEIRAILRHGGALSF